MNLSQLHSCVHRVVSGLMAGTLTADSGGGVTVGAISQFLGVGLDDAKRVAEEVTAVVNEMRKDGSEVVGDSDEARAELERNGEQGATAYQPSGEMCRDIANRFTYHPPMQSQITRYTAIRGKACRFALDLMEDCPPSDELTVALRKLDEVVMFANAAIARNENR